MAPTPPQTPKPATMKPEYTLHYYCNTCDKGYALPMDPESDPTSHIFGTYKPCASKKGKCTDQMMLWHVAPYSPYRCSLHLPDEELPQSLWKRLLNALKPTKS